MSSNASRRSLIAGAAALPAILAVPALAATVTGTKLVSSLIEANDHPQRTADKIVEIADKMIAERSFGNAWKGYRR
jgi:hypothetical protein